MITLKLFHLKTFSAILSEGKQQYLWNSPYDESDCYTIDPINLKDSILSFDNWAEAQEYLVGARQVAAALLIEKLECKPEKTGGKGLTPSESRRLLVDHVINTLLPNKGYVVALQFVQAIKAYHEPEPSQVQDLTRAFAGEAEEATLRLDKIIKQKEMAMDWKMQQAFTHIESVLIPEGRFEEAKSVIFHALRKNHLPNDNLVRNAERLYKAAKYANGLAMKEKFENEPDYKIRMATTPKKRLF